MLRTIAGFLALLISSSAFGQSAVLQGGGWTAGRAPMYVGSGSGQAVVQDSGPAGGGASGLGFRELLLVARGTGTPPYVAQGTGPGGTNFCNYDAPTTNPTGYHYLCMSPNATVAGVTGSIITAGSGGAASPLPLYLCTNGTCVTPTGGIAGLTVGTTTIASGTSNGVLYNNAGVLGNTNSLAGAVLITNGSGVPSFSTSIPSGVVGAALSWYIAGSTQYPTIMSAVAAAKATGQGGTVFVPCGNWQLNTGAVGLDMDNGIYIRITGNGNFGGGSQQCTTVNYTGTGTAISAKGSTAFEFDHIFLNATTAAKIFDFASGAAISATSPYIHDAILVGQTGTTVHIDAASTIDFTIKRTNLAGGSVGIRGITGGGGIAAGQYMVNANISDNNSFQPSLTTGAIQGLETANVDGNVFQGQITALLTGPAATCQLVNWRGNWHGDAVTPQPLINSNCNLFNSEGNTYSPGGGAAITQSNSTGTVSSTGDAFLGANPWVAIGTGNFLHMSGINVSAPPVITGTPNVTAVPSVVTYGSVAIGRAGSGVPLAVQATAGGIGAQIFANDYATNAGIFRFYKDSGAGGAARLLSSGAGLDPIIVDSGNLTLGTAGTSLGQLVMRGGTSGAITVQSQAAAGTYNFNLPTAAGTSGQPLLSGGGGATAMTFGPLALANLATQASNTVVGNATAGAAAPTALAMPSCSTAASALNWTTNTGFGCNSSITAASVPVGGITGLGSGVATWLATPSSANLAAAVTDETGTAGSLVFSGSPTLTTPTFAAAQGGSAAGSTMTLNGTSNGAPSNAYVLLNPSNSQRVGINTSTPLAPLHVGSGADTSALNPTFYINTAGAATFAVRDSTNDIELGMFTNTAAGGLAAMGTRTSHPFWIQTASANVAAFHVSGGFSVGNTIDPGAGAISATGAITATTTVRGTTGFFMTSLMASSTAPTATTFCTSPTIPNNNGTAAFTINVGTACATSTGTITLPAATTGWVCDFHNVTTPASNVVEMTGGTTTTVTLTNYARTTGLASNWTDSHVIRAKCTAY